ncbi:helix-turn-helix domain-containing protein [Rhodobacteraceae bacterium]|nr:helix-turn-helix domain-containing protein [Paracoccaceae bacterium]
MDDISDRDWYAADTATFGDRLAAAREAQGATQKTLARRMGIALKTLEGWENDLREPRANKLQMLSGILDVSMSWLLTGKGQGVQPETNPELPEVTELLREMRQIRTEMQQSAERLGVLEKRLKKVIMQPS